MLKRGAKAATQGKWHDAAGDLLGVVLFHMAHEDHLNDHEMHCFKEDYVSDFFARLSARLKALLARSDAELGLAPPRGVAGGYRPALRALLAGWQLRMNDTLQACDDEPSVAIFTEAEARALAPNATEEEEEEEE